MCTTGTIRLVGGSNSAEGRVEVCSGGAWGTVCDDHWDNTDATVACRQLGYNTGKDGPGVFCTVTLTHIGTALRRAYFGQGSGTILMDDVHCDGTESYLTNCIHITSHNCGHSEDAGVRCACKYNNIMCTHFQFLTFAMQK